MKKTLFWGLIGIVFIERFITYFADNNISRAIRENVQQLPLTIKLFLCIGLVVLLIYLFPYKHIFNKNQ